MARYRDTDMRQKQTDDVFSGREISCDFNEHCNNSTATGVSSFGVPLIALDNRF